MFCTQVKEIVAGQVEPNSREMVGPGGTKVCCMRLLVSFEGSSEMEVGVKPSDGILIKPACSIEW